MRKISIWLVFLLVFEIFILLPVTIYLGNSKEFIAPLFTILQAYLIPMLVVFVLLSLVAYFIDLKERYKLVVILSALIFLIWLQAFVLIGDYGILDGTKMDWSQSNYKSWFDISIWLLVIALAVVFYQRLIKASWKIVSLILVAQSAVMMVTFVNTLDKDEHLLSEKQLNNTGENIYHFSATTNVLHIVLDAYQSEIFEQLVNHPVLGPDYQQDLSGFVFFDEALGTFPYTRFAIASYVSNVFYENKETKDEFNEQIFAGDNIFNLASEKGFEFDFITNENWSHFFAKTKHKNSYIHSNKADDFQTASATFIFDLSLFRMLPHVLKKYIYNDQKWFTSSLIPGEVHMRFSHFKDLVFVSDLIKNAQASRNQPVYKYLHILSPHRPLVTLPDCTFAGGSLKASEQNILIQSKCSLDAVIELFEKLKQLGIYDKTLIVLHSDHGSKVDAQRYDRDAINKNLEKPLLYKTISRASPLLAIKPIQAKNPLRTSSTLVSIADIPDTISSLMNWNHSYGSQSVFDLPEGNQRDRYFYFYDWQNEDAWTSDHAGPVYKYKITGNHYNTSWELEAIFNPPE